MADERKINRILSTVIDARADLLEAKNDIAILGQVKFEPDKAVLVAQSKKQLSDADELLLNVMNNLINLR